MTNKKCKGCVLGASAFHGNPYDDQSFKELIALAEKMTETEIKTAFVDRGYKGHNQEGNTTVWLSRQKRGVTKAIEKKLKRRQAIEPYFGHMKRESKLGKCRLRRTAEDEAYAVLVAAGYNLRLILNHLKGLLLPILLHTIFA
jgi:IS5 family transposase